MEIVPMAAAHTAAIAALERLCFPDPWSEALIAGELENPLSRWLVALRGGAVAGYAGAQAVGPQADVMNLAVDPARRRATKGRCPLETCRLLKKAGENFFALRAYGWDSSFLRISASSFGFR